VIGERSGAFVGWKDIWDGNRGVEGATYGGHLVNIIGSVVEVEEGIR